LGQQSVANQGSLLTSAGAASAAGTVGSANNLSAGLNTAGNSYLNYLLLNQLNGGGGSAAGASGDQLAYNALLNATPGSYGPGWG
jgi:hypothetical protein